MQLSNVPRKESAELGGLLVFGLVEHQHIGMNVDVGPPSLAGFPPPQMLGFT